MANLKTGFPGKPNYRIQADELNEQLQRSAQLKEAVGTLTKWFDVPRGAPYVTNNSDERLWAAFLSETDNPVAWCASLPAYLPAELDGCVGAGALIENLDPLVRYIIGRACMRSMILRPNDTAGLSLAYELIWPIAHDGVAYAGADDELLDNLANASDARAEIESEARRLAANPTSATRAFDRDRTAQAIEKASAPESLEACTHWQIRDLLFDIKFGRVVQVIATWDALFAAKLLAIIGNAALVASLIRRSMILDILALAALLRAVGTAFDLSDNWTGSVTAWMILLEIEERLLERLQEQIRSVRAGGPVPPDPGEIVKQEIEIAAEAVLSRIDGARLALEWLAHLVWSIILQRPSASRAGEDDLSALEPRLVLFRALGIRFAPKDWTNPLRIWTLFGGSPVVSDVNHLPHPGREEQLLLPSWRDWLGQRNSLVPIAVAVHLWDATVSPAGWLATWAKLLCRDLLDQPVAHQLAESGPSQAASYLAWPLVHSGLPSERFDELWADSDWQRTRARFSKLEQAADAVRPCIAIIRVGLRMLEWSSLRSADDASALASSLADAIDEVRYTLPEIGVFEWSSLVGKLAGVMAATGLLKDAGCGQLLTRYDGDDDSLAAAIVNIVANGVSVWEVRQALHAMGENATKLVERWAAWNQHHAKDKRGQSSPFFVQLLAISKATSEAN